MIVFELKGEWEWGGFTRVAPFNSLLLGYITDFEKIQKTKYKKYHTDFYLVQYQQSYPMIYHSKFLEIIKYYNIIRENFWGFIHNRILFKNVPVFLILVVTGILSGILPVPYSSFILLTPTMILSSTTLLVPLVVLVLAAFFYKFNHTIDLNVKSENTELNRKRRDKFRATYLHISILTIFTIIYPIIYQSELYWSQILSQTISWIYLVSIFIIMYESWQLGVDVTGIHYSIGISATAHPQSSIDISSSQKP